MMGFEMAPSDHNEEISALRRRVSDLEADVQRHKMACEERFRRLADAAPVMIWMSGPDARCTYFNRAWLDFRGRTLDDEMGNGWTAGLHPDDRDLCMETYIKSFTSRQPFRMQHRMERHDGQYCWLENSGIPRLENDGELTGFMGSALDITDRKRGFFTPDEQSVRMVFALTERERQVLVLIADGKSTKEAAAQLGISYKTADSHRSRILEKLGVHETASMVRYAIRAGLIEA